MKTAQHSNYRTVAVLCAFVAVVIGLSSASAFAGRADDIARVIAGFPSSTEKFGIAEDPAWRAYSREISGYWSEYDRRIATPMRVWGCRELDQPETKTVFYPFSGPD